MTESRLSLKAQLKLYQLVSPSLPVGGFTYSQGLEWAIEKGWVSDSASLGEWLESLLFASQAGLEIPVLLRVYHALSDGDYSLAGFWCDFLVASRETRELRYEEQQRGIAYARLLPGLGLPLSEPEHELVSRTQVAAFALAMQRWNLPVEDALNAYLWCWLENAVMTGIKLIPLGQTDGQNLLMKLATRIPDALDMARQIEDFTIGSFALHR